MQNEKRLVPQLRFPEFQDELEITTIGKVIQSTLYGPRFNANDYSENGNVKTIRGTDLSNDGEISYDQVPLALLDRKMVATHKLEDGDIVMITTADCGSTGVFRQQDIDYLSSAYGVRIRLNELGYPFYFKYFFQTWLAKREINKYIRKATVANLPGSDILRIKLNLISLPEQQKIAAFLTAIDKRLQSLEKKKNLLGEYKKGVLQKIFKQEIRFKNNDGEVFPKWEKRKFSDVLFEHKLKSTGNEEVHSVSVHKGVINQIEHLGRSFSAKNTDHYSRALPNDIIYTKSPTGDFPLGIIKQNHIKKDVIISPLYGVFTPETKELGYMLHVYFESPINTSNYLSSIIQKGAKNTINITNNTFLSKKLLLPVSKEEQTKIANFLWAIDKKIELVSEQIEKTKTYKKGLLQQMFV